MSVATAANPATAAAAVIREGSEALRNAFKAAVKKRGLNPLVRANKAGCLDQCELGPTVVIYPQAIWYGRVSLDDVERIVDQTILAGNILEDLRIDEALLNTKGKGEGAGIRAEGPACDVVAGEASTDENAPTGTPESSPEGS